LGRCFRSSYRRPLNTKRGNEIPGLRREAGGGGIGVDVFYRGEKRFLITDEDLPAAASPGGTFKFHNVRCGAFELIDDVFYSVLRAQNEYMHVVVHYCTGRDFHRQTLDDFPERSGDNWPRTVIKEKWRSRKTRCCCCPKVHQLMFHGLRILSAIFDFAQYPQLVIVNLFGIRAARVIREPRAVRSENCMIGDYRSRILRCLAVAGTATFCEIV